METTYGTHSWRCKRCGHVEMVYSVEDGVARIEAWLRDDSDLTRFRDAWRESEYYIRRTLGIRESLPTRLMRFVFGGRR